MISIDTISLQLGACEFSDDAQLFIQPSAINNMTGEFIDKVLFETDKGRTVMGKRAYANHEDFQVDVAWAYDNIGVYAKMSVPKMHYNNGLNFQGVSDTDTINAIDSLQNGLREIGVKTDIWKSRINRVDTFSNIKTEHPFEDYAGVLGCLRARRMKKLNYGASTFLWHNTQAELTCYDKEQEMRSKVAKNKLSKTLLDSIPARVARFEHRVKKGRKLESQCQFRYTRELKRDGLRRLKENYIEQFSDVFKLEPKDLISGWLKHEMKNDMVFFQEQHGRNWFSKFLKYRGLAMLVQMASVDSLRECLLEVTGDRHKALRFEKEMERVLDYKPDGDSIEWKNINELYVELKTKLLKQEV